MLSQPVLLAQSRESSLLLAPLLAPCLHDACTCCHRSASLLEGGRIDRALLIDLYQGDSAKRRGRFSAQFEFPPTGQPCNESPADQGSLRVVQ